MRSPSAWAETGSGDEALDASLDAVGVRRALLATFDSPGYRPPVLPTVALDLYALARDPDVEMRKIAELAEKEPLLCADVIRRAQTALFSRSEKVRSIQQAIVTLGLVNVANLFLELAMTARVFKARGFEAPMEQLRRHSVATAHAATRVARHTSVPEDAAFLCGLLHDVGLAAGMIAISERVRPRDLPSFTAAWPALHAVHEAAGRELSRLWGLPADVANAVSGHHASVRGGVLHPLSAIVSIAQYEASLAGYDVGEDCEDPKWARAALDLEGLDETMRSEIDAAVRVVA